VCTLHLAMSVLFFHLTVSQLSWGLPVSSVSISGFLFSHPGTWFILHPIDRLGDYIVYNAPGGACIVLVLQCYASLILMVIICLCFTQKTKSSRITHLTYSSGT
jgi:hypothetical protein